MRLGAYPCATKDGTLTHRIYGKKEISERHRHRFEVNNAYRETLEKAGLTLSGTSPDNELVEIIELKDHPWFIGVQFHPEFKSAPRTPHPLFRSFIAAALQHRNARLARSTNGVEAIATPKGNQFMVPDATSESLTEATVELANR
jgi:CTP synthase